MEINTDTDGVNFLGMTKKVEQVKAVVFVSSGIKDEKITDENSIYDTKYLAKLGQEGFLIFSG